MVRDAPAKLPRLLQDSIDVQIPLSMVLVFVGWSIRGVVKVRQILIESLLLRKKGSSLRSCSKALIIIPASSWAPTDDCFGHASSYELQHCALPVIILVERLTAHCFRTCWKLSQGGGGHRLSNFAI